MALDENHIISRGEIYVLSDDAVRWIPDTSDDDKRRYILILQLDRDNHNPKYPIIIAAPITTKEWGLTKQDVWVEIGESSLPKRSLVKLSVIQPFDRDDIIEYFGSVRPEAMRRVNATLAVNLGLVKV